MSSSPTIGSARIPLIEVFATVADPRARRGVRPVSYTHLRAHETVLDLVCRLLLEKKTRSPETRRNILHVT